MSQKKPEPCCKCKRADQIVYVFTDLGIFCGGCLTAPASLAPPFPKREPWGPR